MSEVAHSSLQDIVDVTSPEDRERWIVRLIIIEQSSDMYRRQVHTPRVNLLAKMCGYDDAQVTRMRKQVAARMKPDEELFRLALKHKDR